MLFVCGNGEIKATTAEARKTLGIEYRTLNSEDFPVLKFSGLLDDVAMIYE
jgi:hypothetical protein